MIFLGNLALWLPLILMLLLIFQIYQTRNEIEELQMKQGINNKNTSYAVYNYGTTIADYNYNNYNNSAKPKSNTLKCSYCNNSDCTDCAPPMRWCKCTPVCCSFYCIMLIGIEIFFYLIFGKFATTTSHYSNQTLGWWQEINVVLFVIHVLVSLYYERKYIRISSKNTGINIKTSKCEKMLDYSIVITTLITAIKGILDYTFDNGIASLIIDFSLVLLLQNYYNNAKELLVTDGINIGDISLTGMFCQGLAMIGCFSMILWQIIVLIEQNIFDLYVSPVEMNLYWTDVAGLLVFVIVSIGIYEKWNLIHNILPSSNNSNYNNNYNVTLKIVDNSKENRDNNNNSNNSNENNCKRENKFCIRFIIAFMSIWFICGLVLCILLIVYETGNNNPRLDDANDVSMYDTNGTAINNGSFLDVISATLFVILEIFVKCLDCYFNTKVSSNKNNNNRNLARQVTVTPRCATPIGGGGGSINIAVAHAGSISGYGGGVSTSQLQRIGNDTSAPRGPKMTKSESPDSTGNYNAGTAIASVGNSNTTKFNYNSYYNVSPPPSESCHRSINKQDDGQRILQQ